MKSLILSVAALIGIASLAGESEFVAAYDSGKYDVAAAQIDSLDISKPGIARRLGVMYYDGRGVAGNQELGRSLLEDAMVQGDSLAAINLAKIYIKVEKNATKASWCLLAAEAAGGNAVEGDIAKLKQVLGDEYLKGVVSYFVQIRKELEDAQTALSDSAKKFADERAGLRGQISAAEESRKEAERKFEKEKSKHQTAVDEYEGRIRILSDKVAAHERALEQAGQDGGRADKNLERLKEDLELAKKELEQEKAKLAQAKNDLDRARKELKTREEESAKVVAKLMDKIKELSDALSASTTVTRYNALVEKYNILVEKYNALLLEPEKDMLAQGPEQKYPGTDGDVGTHAANHGEMTGGRGGKQTTGVNFIRGWNTFWGAPCNLLRTSSAVSEIYDSTASETSGAFGFCVSAVSTPVVLCCEVVPTACDLVNGLVDMLSFGAYGNWLYSGDLKPAWSERDNTHFPWLD